MKKIFQLNEIKQIHDSPQNILTSKIEPLKKSSSFLRAIKEPAINKITVPKYPKIRFNLVRAGNQPEQNFQPKKFLNKKKKPEKEIYILISSSNSKEESDSNHISNFNKSNGRWNKEEHDRFCEAILGFGNDWKKIQQFVGTRSGTQIRSHAQKFLLKIKENSFFLEKGLTPDMTWGKAMSFLKDNLSKEELTTIFKYPSFRKINRTKNKSVNKKEENSSKSTSLNESSSSNNIIAQKNEKEKKNENDYIPNEKKYDENNEENKEEHSEKEEKINKEDKENIFYENEENSRAENCFFNYNNYFNLNFGLNEQNNFFGPFRREEQEKNLICNDFLSYFDFPKKDNDLNDSFEDNSLIQMNQKFINYLSQNNSFNQIILYLKGNKKYI